MERNWDCIVVGGGAAGLSAALVLGRARRRTLLVDAGEQSNLPARGIGGLLGHDGLPPGELYALGAKEIAAYPAVEVRTGTVVAAHRSGPWFECELGDGTRERTRRVILAGGMDYRAPSLPGIAERWGVAVFHCPFCHGWEVRDRPLGVLDSGPTGVHRALLLRNWSDDVTLFTNGPSRLDADDRRRLEAALVPVDDRTVTELRGPAPSLTEVVFADGSTRRCEGLLVPVTLHQRSTLAEQLGATAAEPSQLAADAVVVDALWQTTSAGVMAAGDVGAAPMPSVANAIAAGSNAAASVVRSLLVEDHGLA